MHILHVLSIFTYGFKPALINKAYLEFSDILCREMNDSPTIWNATISETITLHNTLHTSTKLIRSRREKLENVDCLLRNTIELLWWTKDSLFWFVSVFIHQSHNKMVIKLGQIELAKLCLLWHVLNEWQTQSYTMSICFPHALHCFSQPHDVN